MTVSHGHKSRNAYGLGTNHCAVNENHLVKMNGKSVLIMDDDAILLNVVCSMLEFAGYQAFATQDCAEAVLSYQDAKQSGNSFDAVILDLHIGRGKGGKETVQELLEIDPDVRAIVASGDTTDRAMMDHKTFGFRCVLQKPFTMEEMVQALESVMDNPVGVLRRCA